MVYALLLAAAAPQGLCVDPDETTLVGRMALQGGISCKRRGPPPIIRPPSAALQSAIRRHLEIQLMDGPSARYVWLDRIGDRGSYCGYVNAKNGFGGYTGYRFFFATFDPKTLRIEDVLVAPSNGETLERILCESAGYAPAPK